MLNKKNDEITELETANSRLKMMYEHAKELGEKNSKSDHEGRESAKRNETKVKDTKVTKEGQPKPKCHYENKGSCRDQERCNFSHPIKTCQAFSKLGSCSQESLCEHRHPHKVCFRLQNTGYCSAGDRCRDRHPLEYAYQEYPQSNFRNHNYYNNSNNNFLGSSPHSLQGQGVSNQSFPGPFQGAASQGLPHQLPHPGQGGPHALPHQHPQPGQGGLQGWGSQNW